MLNIAWRSPTRFLASCFSHIKWQPKNNDFNSLGDYTYVQIKQILFCTDLYLCETSLVLNDVAEAICNDVVDERPKYNLVVRIPTYKAGDLYTSSDGIPAYGLL